MYKRQIYQGEELGMTNAYMDEIEDYRAVSYTQLDVYKRQNGTQSAQTPGDYFKSELEKQPDTYDAESFCDYILSQNAYETADGSTCLLYTSRH